MSQTTAIATASPAQPPVLDRQEAVLRALNLDPRDPKTEALVLTCQRYRLDPLLKHAVLIKGTLYVTRDGLIHIAHTSGVFDGIEVEFIEENKTHFVARASVWRKDMGRPFVYQGRFPKNGNNPIGGQYGPEMAEKVAECRALRRAFSIALCSQEELWEEASPTATHQAPRPAPAPAPRAIAPAPRGPRVPTPPPDWDPRGEFIALAKEQGQDILGEGGKPSKEKLIALLNAVYGSTTIDELPASRDLWDSALKALQNYNPTEAPAPLDIDTEGLEDPFQE